MALNLPLSTRPKPGIFGEERRLLVVTEDAYADTRQFAVLCGRHVEAIDADDDQAALPN